MIRRKMITEKQWFTKHYTEHTIEQHETHKTGVGVGGVNSDAPEKSHLSAPLVITVVLNNANIMWYDCSLSSLGRASSMKKVVGLS
jgi:hypothetical protein